MLIWRETWLTARTEDHEIRRAERIQANKYQEGSLQYVGLFVSPTYCRAAWVREIHNIMLSSIRQVQTDENVITARILIHKRQVVCVLDQLGRSSFDFMVRHLAQCKSFRKVTILGMK